ncbi:importin-9-like isoform X2 [Cucurbita maxima]|uniref:Importin-9-like isoform X2 n=1 Tax=Cucurbita maxima TaxID=3661 RepID=A0A6J1HTD0_CUCMA|nr:importin-9-like isoform X2 [Cucurbita maxima]
MSYTYVSVLYEDQEQIKFSGFGVALSKVTANMELPVGLRQLAAVLLKQFIKKHWQEGDELFEHPAVSDDDKAVIRKLLLLTLDDSHTKICTAISMAVASIAIYDWPEEWPELLPYLLNLMNNRINMNGVHGGLRCLALLSGELDCEMIPRLVPALFPHLFSIVSSPEGLMILQIFGVESIVFSLLLLQVGLQVSYGIK